MSKETNHEDSLEKLEQSMKKLDSVNNVIVSSQLQQLSDTMQKINDAVSAIQSDAMKAVIDLGNRIAELVVSVDFSSILKKFSEVTIPFQYIGLLERVKWPVFLIDDDALRQDILTACADLEDEEAVREIIFSYCSDDFLKAMEDDWNSCEAISAERKPILSEAMLMHKQGYYYASTSMLMCQIYGVASDVNNLAKRMDWK